ncbi:O-methyltransferase mdmC [Tetrabaena socialis]|uniref:O-methyltransferase mdmC n=1 Tax=Tetrabaena socialis TaxID=47790 RepID=A0A2J8A6C3_9CHLO|nr:O-methyltransferase mdmC [Tetrabaena socialis]|eukprot:PNH08045.1 O-methyltransferase mdmC [Tetrabaena socialis]
MVPNSLSLLDMSPLPNLSHRIPAVRAAALQITPEQGALLGLLVQLMGARRVVEVGVFTGYSSCAMAMALPADGRLVALDRDERHMEMARRFWQLAGVAEQVECMIGPASASLERLLERDGPGSYDMAFIDADKRSYDGYYEQLLELVRPGGLIAIDNTLFYGRVVQPQAGDKAAEALRDLNTKLLHDPRVSVSLVPIGDGMTLCMCRPSQGLQGP